VSAGFVEQVVKSVPVFVFFGRVTAFEIVPGLQQAFQLSLS